MIRTDIAVQQRHGAVQRLFPGDVARIAAGFVAFEQIQQVDAQAPENLVR
jgi:hypothetical protein